ncbi:GroES family chaperonin [Austwickia chelonae]|uniref:GroES family chaperonin n=1 Tax=Austwickia chelonae TaxID=100225 RepID=UPI001967A4A4|nr:co-chaperone GroES [Austwickia chelonae]
MADPELPDDGAYDEPTNTDEPADASPRRQAVSEGGLALRMLHDRVLLSDEGEKGERQTGGGLIIPATAQLGKRLAWATVVAVGANVRQVRLADRALYDPSERATVELDGREYVLLRERDLHAVSTPEKDPDAGLYL